MRIVVDARCIQPHFPGLGRYTLNLIRALPSVSSDEIVAVTEQVQPDVLTLGVTRLTVRAPVRSLREQWAIPRAVRHLAATIYHAPYYFRPYFVPAPSVVTVSDVIPALLPMALPSRPARLAYEIAMRLTLAGARRILTLSGCVRRDLIRHYRIRPERVAVTPAGLDPSFRPPTRSAIALVRERYGLQEDYLLYVGINKPHKNLRRLVDAYARFASARPERLVLAGPEDARYSDVRQAIARHHLGHRVSILGPVDEPDLPALYAGAVLFVFPSLYEGFGLPVLEAMGCGTPVACSVTGALPEVAGAAALTFDPFNSAAIADAIVRVLEDRGLRDDLRHRGLARAREYTWAATAEATLQVYREALM
ncbi:MAG TPA: glycosyltransferase family 1 protein [Alphaproteobacteria bacterium]|nr:glycosyltransferase family 1 protein [Alphaproteobacteria bacterium]